MKRQLYGFDDVVKALQKGFVIEVHDKGYGYVWAEDDSAFDDVDLYFRTRETAKVYICHRLRDFPETFEDTLETALNGGYGFSFDPYWYVQLYAVSRLQSQR